MIASHSRSKNLTCQMSSKIGEGGARYSLKKLVAASTTRVRQLSASLFEPVLKRFAFQIVRTNRIFERRASYRYIGNPRVGVKSGDSD
jgi:hypothetical protein